MTDPPPSAKRLSLHDYGLHSLAIELGDSLHDYGLRSLAIALGDSFHDYGLRSLAIAIEDNVCVHWLSAILAAKCHDDYEYSLCL